jgi:hypothetical protein
VNEFIERFVLRGTFTSDDVDFVSVQRGWILRRHQMPEGGAYIDGWVTLDRQTEIHQVDVRPIATRPRRTRSRQRRGHTAHPPNCDLWSTTEPPGHALSRHPHRPVGGEHPSRGLGGELADRATCRRVRRRVVCDAAEVARAFRTIASHPDAGVRQSVIIATGYFPHTTPISLIRGLRDEDPADHVRTNAQHLLEPH